MQVKFDGVGCGAGARAKGARETTNKWPHAKRALRAER